MDKYGIAIIEGGAGKSVVFTAVAQAIKKAHPDRQLFVFTAYPEVLLNCPAIDRVYRLGQVNYFYDDFIKGKDVEFFCEEPYKSRTFLKEEKHIIQAWCDCVGVPYSGEVPSFHLNPVELEMAYRRIAHIQKPIIVIQPNGGGNQNLPYSWNRDIPTKQITEMVGILNQKYHILHFGRDNQPNINGAEKIPGSIRELVAIMTFSKGRILIDSCFQHAAAALNLPSTVCWITNHPRNWGYSIHKNILPKVGIENTIIHRPEAFLNEFDFTGGRFYDYKYNTHDIFNTTEIINTYMQA